MYGELADWWPVLSDPADYAEEALIFRDAIVALSRRPVSNLLELGSGGGNNASHLKAFFRMTLCDRSEGMLAASSALNPECEHVAGDMRSVRLGRTFDGVFVHDAVCYMTTQDDLRLAMETAFAHCESGGVALFVPDFTRETFAASTDSGGHDRDGRRMRYLQWTHEPEPGGSTYRTDFVYLLRDGDACSVRHETHEFGLFGRADWLRLLDGVGFEAAAVPYAHSTFHDGPREMFAGLRA
jgi:SAM-dependent methyltransferase